MTRAGKSMANKVLLASLLMISAGCQLLNNKSQLRSSNSSTAAEKAIADTIALGLSYPYERESGSYLFLNGTPYPYEFIGKDPLVDGTLRVGGKVVQVDKFLNDLSRDGKQPKPQPLSARTPVIAYGSNAAVSALKRKFISEKFPRGWAILPVLKGTLKDFEVVHAAHFVPVNGSFPAGIAYNRGAETEIWLTFLDDAEMERMHASEGIDSDSPQSWYVYGKLENIRIQVPGWRELSSAFVYIDNYGALKVQGQTAALSKVPATARSPQVSMEAALASAEDIFKVHPSSAEAEKICAKWTGIEKRLCENIVDPCARDARTDALQNNARRELWSLPPSSGVKFTRLAGSESAGHPKAFPESMRCAVGKAAP